MDLDCIGGSLKKSEQTGGHSPRNGDTATKKTLVFFNLFIIFILLYDFDRVSLTEQFINDDVMMNKNVQVVVFQRF